MSDYPSLKKQGKNLLKFLSDVFTHSKTPFVSDEISRERMEICTRCVYYDPSQIRCKECGCFLKAKTRFAVNGCPIGAWPVLEEEWIEDNQLTFRIYTNYIRLGFGDLTIIGITIPNMLVELIVKIKKFIQRNKNS